MTRKNPNIRKRLRDACTLRNAKTLISSTTSSRFGDLTRPKRSDMMFTVKDQGLPRTVGGRETLGLAAVAAQGNKNIAAD